MNEKIKIITLGDIFKNLETEEKAFKLKDYITNLQKQAELGEHYKHLYSEVKKQKDDVVKFVKHIKPILKEYNYEPYRVNTALEDLLRMLGDSDE